jgi:hypothetical protein
LRAGVRPEAGQSHRLLELAAGRVGGRADVEAHRDVGAELGLRAGGQLRCQARRVAVVDRAEGDAVVVQAEDRVAEREDLEAAGVGQDRAVPAHEGVQPAELGDRLRAGTEVQVVGVAEQDLGAEVAQLAGVDALDRGLGADGHEGRRAQLTVRRREHSRPGRAVSRGQRKPVHETATPPPFLWVGLVGHPRSRCERSRRRRACL